MAEHRRNPPVATLKKRSEFLRVRGGARWGAASFALEARPREAGSALQGKSRQDVRSALPFEAADTKSAAGTIAEEPREFARFGFTVTKKIGNAVARNRIRRRLREAVRETAQEFARADCDYVLIARAAALSQQFAQLRADLQTAFQRVHAILDGKQAKRRKRSGRQVPRGGSSQ